MCPTNFYYTCAWSGWNKLQIMIIVMIIACSYCANFICMPRHNAKKYCIVFIVDWSGNYTCKLSKFFVEKVSLSLFLKESDGACWACCEVEGSKVLGLPCWKLAFQMFQATILVNWGDIDPSNIGAVMVHIFISMLWHIVEHGNSVPCRRGAEFCNWLYAQQEANAVLSTWGYIVKLAPFKCNPSCIVLAALQSDNVGLFCSV